MNQTDVDTIFGYVKEFHNTYEQSIRTEPQWDIPERVMRQDLIIEEGNEWEEELSKDSIGHLHFDALGDTVYVAVGAALAHGLEDKVIAELNNPDNPAVSFGREFATNIELTQLTKTYKVESDAGDIDAISKTIASLIIWCYETSALLGVNLTDVIDHIQASNLSKLGEDGKPIKRADGKTLKGPNFFEPEEGIKAVILEQWGAERANKLASLVNW